MEFLCNSNKLKHGIALVEKAVSQKSSLPVLENIFIELKNGALTLRGNNLEIGIENNLNIEPPQAEGSVLVKAKTLSGILSKIENESLSIKVSTDNKIAIKGENVDFDILGSDTQDYPVFPSLEEGVTLRLGVDELRELIKHTIIAVSYDETKQFLNGILVNSEGDQLAFVATDGYRLSLKKQNIPPLNAPVNLIIPFKAVNELNKILQTADITKNIEITLSSNQAAFKMGTFLLISRVIQGQFPDYKQVIPTTSQNKLTVNREAFLAAAERASIIASASNNVVRFTFAQTHVSLQANAHGLGDFKEEIALTRKEGQDEVKVAFNIRLLIDVLKTISDETVMLSLNNELSPCKIELESDASFTYIIMPIRTTDYQA